MSLRRFIQTLPVALLLFSALPEPAYAGDVKVGVRGGYYTKLDKPFLGAELLVRAAPRFYFNPNLEYVFIDNGSYLTLNGDFHYDFPTHSSTFVWLGAGPAVLRVDPEGPAGADHDLAANLLAGVGFKTGSVIPYFQMKAIIKDDSVFSFAVGIRF